MERLIFLGTGNAAVTRCYNSCFLIERAGGYLMVDAGGGNGILTQLEKAEVPLTSIHHLFVSHSHTDHLLGVIWVVRMIGAKMNGGSYQGDFHIYCHSGLVDIITTICRMTLTKAILKHLGERIIFHAVSDGERAEVMGYDVEFFDIGSTKIEQYGFLLTLESGRRFTFIGDEPYRESEEKYAQGADWLLHEAFCLYSEREKFKPYQKHHATVKEACEQAQKLGVKNLVMYHTEDKNLTHRKELYTAEGRPYFGGNIFVPDDLDIIEL